MTNARQIKFRVWDGKKFIKEESGGETFSISFDGKVLGHYCDDLTVYPEGAYTPQQFTGLLDKNGKEIYEGDIVELYTDKTVFSGASKSDAPPVLASLSRVREVRFASGCFYVSNNGFKPLFVYNYKILGNIFENLELLTLED